MTLSIAALLRKPAGWAPILLATIALVFVLGYVASFAVVRNADEGTPARFFQLAMALDALTILWFAIRWVPVVPRAALPVLGLQLLAAALPVATVAFLEM